MTWIDTHCHIDSDKLSPNIQDVLKSGLKAGISGLVVPATSKNNFDRIIDVAHNYPQCFFALGFHPLFIDDYEEGDMDVLTAYIKKHNPIAVGEIGIDLFTRKDNLIQQENLFVKQIELAKSYDLPVIIHARSAIDRVLKYLRVVKLSGGIIHAFNGSFQQAEQLISLGFKLGFGGAMTYERAIHIKKLAQLLPIHSIVLETDSPDMNPAWLEKGTPNEPKELNKIARFLSELRGIKLDKLAETIRVNSVTALPKLAELYT
jgi:TatD DNase family protein|tara:strand:- start:1725 stop:2507 length:783 start_codon:yes stop_codon:yes gene_type:complete